MLTVKLTSEDLTLLVLRGDNDSRPALKGLTVVVNPDGTGRVLAANGFLIGERELSAKAITGADGQLHEFNVAIPTNLPHPREELTIKWTPGDTSFLLRVGQWAATTELLAPSGVLKESLWPAGLPETTVALDAKLLCLILKGLPPGISISLRVFGKEKPVEFRLSNSTRGMVMPMFLHINPKEWHPRPAEKVAAANTEAEGEMG